MATEHKHPHEDHMHDHPNRKKVSRRVALILGHLKAVQRMIEEGEDCCEVLIQMSAIRSAINGAAKDLLDDHINNCLSRAYKENDTEMILSMSDAIDRYMNLK